MNSLNLLHSPFARTRPPSGCPVNWSHPLSQGLGVLWIPNRGNRAVDLGSNQNSSLNFTAITEIADAQFGSMWSFNGTSSFIESTNLVRRVSGTLPFSSEAWVRVSTKPGSTTYFQVMMCSQGMNIDAYDKGILIDSSGFARGYGYDGTGRFAQGTTDITNGARHHLVTTYNGATLSIFVDGRLEGTAACASTFAESPQRIILGNRGATGLPFTNWYPGQIAYASFRYKCLSPAEVRQLYSEPFCMLRGPR